MTRGISEVSETAVQAVSGKPAKLAGKKGQQGTFRLTSSTFPSIVQVQLRGM